MILEKEIHTVVLGGSHEETGVVTQEHLQLLSEELGKELKCGIHRRP